MKKISMDVEGIKQEHQLISEKEQVEKEFILTNMMMTMNMTMMRMTMTMMTRWSSSTS